MKKNFQALTKNFHAWPFFLKIILCALRPMCVQRYACDKLLDKNGRAEKCGRICSERRDAFTDEQVEKVNLKAVLLGHIRLFSFFSTPLTSGICKMRGVEICAGGACLLILPRKHPSPTCSSRYGHVYHPLSVHPFNDGNGRCRRMLPILYLVGANLLSRVNVTEKGKRGQRERNMYPKKAFSAHPSASAHGAARQAALLIIYMTPHRQRLTPQHI